ncbi:MAG: dihydrofolate reductase [Candidatus Eremiobacteraeota bacterium]|nr:dihydrofolate reductase [Candidatus Eremiobacteraeota bacterium]
MSRLIYIINASLDGFVEDAGGAIDWADPDGVFDVITRLLQPVGTYLYGRKTYEAMAYWDAPPESYPSEHRNFARIWQQPNKIVFSRTLTGVSTCNTRIERNFDLEAIRKLKRESQLDITIGGAELAGLALEADLIDECHLFLYPIIVGGGKPAFRHGLRRNLELLETRRFGTGAIHLHYRVQDGSHRARDVYGDAVAEAGGLGVLGSGSTRSPICG